MELLENKGIKYNLAIVSPSKDAYSETFIQAHKNIQKNTFFYYGGFVPRYLEGYGELGKANNYFGRFYNICRRKLKITNFNYYEENLIRSLKRKKIQNLLAEYGPSAASVWRICAKNKIKLFIHFHGYDASVYELVEKYKEEYLNMFAYATKVFVVSNEMYNKVLSLGCNANKLILNTYGPRSIFLDIHPTFSDKFSFLAFGRFTHKKAPYYTILAFRKVLNKIPNAKLYMAGDGVLLETCKNLVKYFGMENQVDFLGVISESVLIRKLSEVNCFIQHSITADNGDMEGTPLAILEATAAAIPVVSTFHAGITDVVIDNVTGFLVEEHDVNKMATRMEEIISNPILAKKMGKAGRKRILEFFTMEKHLDTLRENIFN